MTRSMLRPFYEWVERNPDQLLYAWLDIDGRTTGSYTYAQFVQRTTEIAAHIRRNAPLDAGARVLLAYPPGLEMIAAFFACVRLGLIPVPVYPPAGSGFRAALAKMDFIARDCGAAAVLTDRAYYWSMRLNETRHRVATFSLRRSPASRLTWVVTTDAERGCRDAIADVHSPVVFLQYTSGSTSDPKGVMVTHDNLLDNCHAVADHRAIGVSWLPQYHDMGLIGYYLFFSMVGGTTYGFSPFDFIRRPALWLETISRFRGTASSAPNFAYEYCLRPDKVPAATIEQLDLSSLRFLMTAAEPVRPDVCRAFLQRFQPRGLDPKAFFSAYGLAEFTLAVSNYGRTTQAFDRAALNHHRVTPGAPDTGTADVVPLMSCGRTLGRTEVRIVDVTHQPRDAGTGVGEIWIRGPSKCRGYWGRPELSAAVFDARLPGDPADEPGWLRSGDMGFVHDGELYICGRLKDMLIVRGLNVYPQDIEAIVESDSRIRKGCVAAFGRERNGAEELIVVAELRDRRRIPDARAVNQRLQQGLGVTAASLVFIEARTIPKTSSGKIARHLVRDRWAAGELRIVEDVQSESGGMDRTDASPHRVWLRRFLLTGDETWTLSDAGFDSLKLVDFAHALKNQLATVGEQELSSAVDLRVLQRIAICELVELVDELSTATPQARLRFRRALSDLGAEHRALEAEMMRQDSRLRFDPGELSATSDSDRFANVPITATIGDPSTPCVACAPHSAQDDSGGGANGCAPHSAQEDRVGGILLTGGTGFFGPFLLSSLLAQTDGPLYVLARANGHSAIDRIRDGLRSISADGVTCPDGWERRVRLVEGDLAAPRLGLDDGAWNRLADDVGTIYHNGALVNYLLDYPSMRDANVGGTNEVVRLAMTRRPKVLNHISTTFVFGWSAQETLFESDTNAAMAHLDFGYSQSKWVSEQVVLDAIAQGLDARIFRPALLTPSLHGGGYNCDISIRLLAFMIAHGLSTTARNQVSFSPADLAADNIVAVSRIRESIGGTYHVTRDEYATLSDVTEILGSLTGRAFRYFPLHAFVPEVIQRCRPGDILFPLLDFLVRSVDNISAMEFKRYDNSNYRRFRDAAACGRADPPLPDVVEGIMRFLRRRQLVTA